MTAGGANGGDAAGVTNGGDAAGVISDGDAAGGGVQQRTAILPDGQAKVWQIIGEVPVAVALNGTAVAVMMATPQALEDFAVGFLLAEGLLMDATAVEDCVIEPQERGCLAQVTAAPAAVRLDRLRDRTLAGRSSCGLCGVEGLEQAVLPLPTVSPGAVAPAAVLTALRQLPTRQPLNALTRSAHAAALCTAEGAILLVREDVGRHTALDKMIGAAARGGLPLGGGLAVMTSRCSFELVQKAALVGLSALATLSAPTALALDMAAGAGLTLFAADRDGGVVMFPLPLLERRG